VRREQSVVDRNLCGCCCCPLQRKEGKAQARTKRSTDLAVHGLAHVDLQTHINIRAPREDPQTVSRHDVAVDERPDSQSISIVSKSNYVVSGMHIQPSLDHSSPWQRRKGHLSRTRSH